MEWAYETRRTNRALRSTYISAYLPSYSNVRRFGEVYSVELCANGANIVVDNNNRAAYVAAYVSYLLDVSVAPQFDAFARVCMWIYIGVFDWVFRH